MRRIDDLRESKNFIELRGRFHVADRQSDLVEVHISSLRCLTFELSGPKGRSLFGSGGGPQARNEL